MEVIANFAVETAPELEADFELAAPTSNHNELYNRDLPNQHPMDSITGLESALSGLDQAVNDEENRARGVEQELADSIESNHTAISNHVSNKNNPHEVNKAQIGLGNVDNTSDANKPVSIATQTALNKKVDKTTLANKVYGTNSAGQQTTYDADSFGAIDDVQVGGVSVVTNKIARLGTMAGETVGDYYTTTQMDTIVSGLSNSIDANHREIGIIGQTIGTYGNIVTHNVSEFATAAQGLLANTALQPGDLNGYATESWVTNQGYQTSSQVASAVATETNARELADNGLQAQIDAIVSSSDVFDIVGTYAELQAYDISTVPVNDIIKVLVDETHSGAATYYRCVENNNVKSWSYIGSEGAYYTKSEADTRFVPQSRTVNGRALSSDITLTASDVDALPSNTTIGNGALTIQVNSTDLQTFTANQTGNVTANINVPTDTSDLTNGAGYITSTALSGYATELWVNNQGYAIASTLATVATSGSYNDLNNKPTIPTVNDPTITITQGGVTKGSFTLNQSSGDTIALDSGGGTVDQTYNSTSSNAQSGIAIAGAGFLTSAALTNYVTTNTSQTITYDKTFLGDNLINLKPSSTTSTASINFYSSDNLRMGYIQFNPRSGDKVNGTPLLVFGNYATSEQQVAYLGFRQYANYTSGGVSVQGLYNLLAPKIVDARELYPSSGFPTFYLPLAFSDGVNLITCDRHGNVDLSSSFSGKQDSLVSGTNIKTINNESILGSGNIAISGGSSYTAGTNISIVSDKISTSAAQVIIRRL